MIGIQRHAVTIPAAGERRKVAAGGTVIVVESAPDVKGSDLPTLFLDSVQGDGLRAYPRARYGTCGPFGAVWVRGTAATAGMELRFLTGPDWCLRAITPQPAGGGGASTSWDPTADLLLFACGPDEVNGHSLRDPSTGAVEVQLEANLSPTYEDMDVVVNYDLTGTNLTGMVLVSARYGSNNWPRGNAHSFDPTDFNQNGVGSIYGPTTRWMEGASIGTYPKLRLADTSSSIRVGDWTGSGVNNQTLEQLSPALNNRARRPKTIRTDTASNTIFVTFSTENEELRRYTLDTLTEIDVILSALLEDFDIDRNAQKVYYRSNTNSAQVMSMNYDGTNKALLATLPATINDIKLLKVAEPDTVFALANGTVYAIEIATGDTQTIVSLPGTVFQPIPTVAAETL